MSTSMQNAFNRVFDPGSTKTQSETPIWITGFPTHDMSSIYEHTRGIKEVTDCLQTAVGDMRKSPGQSRYQTGVHVLPLRWKDDDLGVATEVDTLGVIFYKSYHNSVKTREIPIANLARELRVCLGEFPKKYEKRDAHLIFYHAGHAEQNIWRSELPIWTSRRSNPTRMESNILHSILSECDSDVLLFYDCRYAVPSASSTQSSGVMKCLVACGFEQDVAAEIGEHSFNNCLIQKLSVASSCSISIFYLCEHMMAQLQNWMSYIDKDISGQMKLSSTGKPLFEHLRQRTLVHGILTNESRQRIIVLSPVSSRFVARNQSPLLHHINVPDYKLIELNPKRRRGTGPTIEAVASKVDSYIKYPQVILSIILSTLDFDISSWRDWTRDAPSETKGIKVEGICNSYFSLMLMRISITTWALLPDNTAHSFVGFVTSENLATKFKEQELIAWTSEGSDAQRATAQGTADQAVVTQEDATGENENGSAKLAAMMGLLPKLPEQKQLGSPPEYDGSQGTTSELKFACKRDSLGRSQGQKSRRSYCTQRNEEEQTDNPDVTATKIRKAEKKESNAEKETLPPNPPYTFLPQPQPQYDHSSRVTLWNCCECGEEGMNDSAVACPTCGHILCANCETYARKRL